MQTIIEDGQEYFIRCVDNDNQCSPVGVLKKLKLPDYEMSLPTYPGGISFENMWMIRHVKNIELSNLYAEYGGGISIILEQDFRY